MSEGTHVTDQTTASENVAEPATSEAGAAANSHTHNDPRNGTGRNREFAKILGAWSRFIVLIPVIGLLLSSITLVVVGAVKTGGTILNVAGINAEAITVQEALVEFVEIADLFLLAIVIYIISLGLYELFIDASLDLPEWLTFTTLDDLKKQLISVVVVVLAVYFMGQTFHHTDGNELFFTGAAIALVVSALALFVSFSKKH